MDTCKTLVEKSRDKTVRGPKDWSSLSSYAACEKPASGSDRSGRPACEEHSL